MEDGSPSHRQPALRLRAQHLRQRPQPPDRRTVRDRGAVVGDETRAETVGAGDRKGDDEECPERRIGARTGAGGGVVGVVVFTRTVARQSAPRGGIPILEFTGRSDRLIFASYESGDDFFRGISGRVAPWSLRRPAG
jgi:hypothetical protein